MCARAVLVKAGSGRMKGLLGNASDAVRRAANVSADAVTGAAVTAFEQGDALSQKADGCGRQATDAADRDGR